MAEPDDRLFFLLQRAAHQLRTTADRRLLTAAGITTAQLGALFAVRDQPGLTQQELARVLGLRESAVTGLVGRLTAAGLVSRGAHPREHRAVVLELTEAGAERCGRPGRRSTVSTRNCAPCSAPKGSPGPRWRCTIWPTGGHEPVRASAGAVGAGPEPSRRPLLRVPAPGSG